MRISEIIDALERFAPVELAEEWDSVGLMIGAKDREVSSVMLALDLTKDVAEQAAREGCGLIVTHHPFFFRPFGSIDFGTGRGALTEYLIKHDIAVYSAHTNLDKTVGGIAWRTAELLGGYGIESDGTGVVFDITGTEAGKLAKTAAEVLGDRSVKLCGDPCRMIARVYAVPGAGGDSASLARARECADVLMSGEVKHHVYIEAADEGFPIIEFSHFGSEAAATDILEGALAHLAGDIGIIKAKQQCPFRILEEI